MKGVYTIPNFLTLLNLFTGCVGIVLLYSEGISEHLLYAVLIAALIDVFDGLAARLLNQKSDIGKDLDSLADVVSFGVLPALILLKLMIQQSGSNTFAYGLPALLIAMSSALRLAKFNHDPRQTDYFIGVPTPANGIFLTAAALSLSKSAAFSQAPSQLTDAYWALLVLVLISTFWLHLPIRLFSLKVSFKNGLKPILPHIVLAIVALSMLAISQDWIFTLACTMGSYVNLSLLFQSAIGKSEPKTT